MRAHVTIRKNFGMLFPIRLIITFLILAIILMVLILASLFMAGLATVLVGIGAFIYGLIKGIAAIFRRKKKKEEKER